MTANGDGGGGRRAKSESILRAEERKKYFLRRFFRVDIDDYTTMATDDDGLWTSFSIASCRFYTTKRQNSIES
jgi:hypothetical protein